MKKERRKFILKRGARYQITLGLSYSRSTCDKDDIKDKLQEYGCIVTLVHGERKSYIAIVRWENPDKEVGLPFFVKNIMEIDRI